MGSEIERLSVGVGADTSAIGAGFSSVGGLVGKLGGMLGSVGGMIVASIGVAAVAIGTFAVKAAKDIEVGTNKIRTGTGATGDALKDLSGSMKNVGKKVPESFGEIGGAIADLNTRLGLTGKPLEKMTEQMLNLGKVTGEDVSGLIAGTTRVFGDWSVSTEDQSSALDHLFKVSQSTGIGVGTLSEKLVKFGAPLRQLGFDMETSAALLGKFEKEGVNADLVMGSMRIALGKMARAGEEPIETFKRVTSEIKNAGSAGEANTLALELFGAKAGPDMAAAIREGRFEIDDLMTSLSGSKETINSAAGDTRTLAERMSILGNNAKVIAAPLGKGLLVAAEHAVKGLISAVQWVSAFIEKLQSGGGAFKTAREVIAKTFAVIRDVVATTIGTILAIWNRFGKQLFNIIKVNLKLIWDSIKVVFKVIQGIFQVFKGIFTGDWSMFWDGIKNIFGGVLDGIKAMFSAAWNTIKNVAAIVWNAISGIAKTIWNAIRAYFQAVLNVYKAIFSAAWNAIKGVVTGIWNAIKGVATAIWNAIKAYFATWLSVVKAIFSTAWNAIKSILSTVWNTIKGVATAIWDIIKGYFTTWLSVVKKAFSVAWDIIKGALELVWNTIKGVAETTWNIIKGVVSTVWDGISGVWASVWGGIRAIIDGAWNGIRGVYDSVIVPLYNALASVWDGLGGVWSRVWGGIVGVVKGAVNGLIKGVNLAIRGINLINPGTDVPPIPQWKDMGGMITGSGRVLVDAEAGEFMMRKRAVRQYGSGMMGAINAGTYKPGGGVGGGYVYLSFTMNATSPEYDSSRMAELTANKIARRGNHTGRVMRKGR